MTSQIQVNLNPQSINQQTHPEVAGQLQGTRSVTREERVDPQWLGRFSHLLAYEFHPFTKPAAAAAKSLQSCPTPYDPMDCSPPGFSAHGILQERTLEWVAISFSNA